MSEPTFLPLWGEAGDILPFNNFIAGSFHFTLVSQAECRGQSYLENVRAWTKINVLRGCMETRLTLAL